MLQFESEDFDSLEDEAHERAEAGAHSFATRTTPPERRATGPRTIPRTTA